MTDIQFTVETVEANGRPAYRATGGGYSSPMLRSPLAAQLFITTGSMSVLVQAFISVQEQASKLANAMNAKSDKELEKMDMEFNPRIVRI